MVAIVMANDGAFLRHRLADGDAVKRVRRLDHHPPPGQAAVERSGHDDGRDRHQDAQSQGDAEVGVQQPDRRHRPRVRRHEAVHRRESGQCRDPHGDQRHLRPSGDQVDDRHQQHQADLEEHRQPDDGPDQGHGPRQRPS
jgi:hypothetical protein